MSLFRTKVIVDLSGSNIEAAPEADQAPSSTESLAEYGARGFWRNNRLTSPTMKKLVYGTFHPIDVVAVDKLSSLFAGAIASMPL
jgi:hypothetical protein